MNDVRIDTPRGITLAGTLQLPAGAAPIDLEVSTTSEDTQPPQARPEGVVLLAHDFLTDRHGQGGRLDWIGARYREAGLATLNLDFSGLGESDDDVITLAGEAEDLRAASRPPATSKEIMPPPPFICFLAMAYWGLDSRKG